MQRFILCVLFCLVTVISARDDELFGWSERTIGRKAQLGSAKRGVIAQQGSAPVLDDDDAPSQEETIGQPTSERETGVEVMSWDPRILLYRGLLTDGTTEKTHFQLDFKQRKQSTSSLLLFSNYRGMRPHNRSLKTWTTP